MSTDEIDALLARYLHLLDHYTALRTRLSTLQSSIHQDIARANFSADRGIRYGQDYYDSRMRASRLVQLTPSEAAEPPVPVLFAMKTATAAGPASAPAGEVHVHGAARSPPPAPTPPPPPPDPLSMFGILVPRPLRRAQASAIAMVDEVVPRLAAVDAEMRGLEIRIRRARKHLKASAGREEGKPPNPPTPLLPSSP